MGTGSVDLPKIGIFDSGIGGLTVAKAIRERLPMLDIVYFGDTAHLPYGDKSDEAVLNYSERISNFLESKGCDAIVIACNTASAIAYDALEKRFKASQIQVFNVIDPVVKKIIDQTTSTRIGVICTRATARSDVYRKKFHQINSDLKVETLATPLLAPMIEDGFINDKISHEIISVYLDQEPLSEIETLILGCTHYPLIRGEIEDLLFEKHKHSVEVIDSAKAMAEHLSKVYGISEQHESDELGDCKFYVSDYTQSFDSSSRYFFGEEIHLLKANLT